jgi:hypothetical protein
MPSEAGDMKILGNFRKLIEIVSAEPNYKPSNEDIKIPALNALDEEATAASEDVSAKNAPNKTAVRERAEAYELLPVRGRQVKNVAKASGAGAAAIKNLDTPLRKLSGGRATPKTKPEANTPAGDDQKEQRSVSQMSYDNQAGNWRTVIALVKELTTYQPNETELKVTALEAFADDLEAKNDAVIATSVPLNKARARRDELIYLADGGVVKRAGLVKAYVKGAFGTASPIYKQIRGLEFKAKKN